MRSILFIFGAILLLGLSEVSAQICPPGRNNNRFDSWNTQQNWNNNTRNWNRGNNRRFAASEDFRSNGFMVYTLDFNTVRNSFDAVLREGIRRGNITSRERRRLERKFDQIVREFDCAYEDGWISSRDRRRIFDEIAEMDDRIYKEWFDNDFR